MRSPDKPKLCKFFAFVSRSKMPPTPKALKASFAPLQSLPSTSSSSSMLAYTGTKATTKMKMWDRKIGPAAEDVTQGALGDCWFLSAISVIASTGEERIRRLFSASSSALSVGAFEITLFIDGRFLPVLIDSYLPAYAKAHGCYDSLSGGYVWEAFFDLLGAPVEVLYLGNHLAPAALDMVWARLSSFKGSNFVLGAACMVSDREQGLVGCHAYGMMECREIFEDVVKGEQKKINSFFKEKGGGGKSN
ncbi:hypothetical protein TrRE_jg3136, partial [Triparma retinervis]